MRAEYVKAEAEWTSGDISTACRDALELSLKHGVPVKFEFNDIEITADFNKAINDVARQYWVGIEKGTKKKETK